MTPPQNEHRFDELFKLVKNRKREEFQAEFRQLHEKDQSEFFSLLYPDNKAKIADLLDPSEFADLFQFMDDEAKWAAFETMPESYLTEASSLIADDVLVAFIAQLEDEDAESVLAMMEPEIREHIERQLARPQDTAGSIMTNQFIQIDWQSTADEVINHMRSIGQQAGMTYYIYCVNEKNHLVGVVSLHDLILSPGDSIVKDIMNTNPRMVSEHTDQEKVARLIQDYDLLALPVVDKKNTLIGIVTIDDVVDIIHEEMTEDFHKFSGIVTEDDPKEGGSVLNMTKQRMPWIIILLFLGLISANLIGRFEDTLSAVVALAVFMPIILDSAGNVGTQSLAISVRSLTFGEKRDKKEFWKVFLQEFATGLLLGIAAGTVIGIISYIMYGNVYLGLVVGLSLFLTLSVASVIGYLVPNIFAKIGIDPAIASGPFITTLCDTSALVLYFSLATKFIHLLT